MIWPVRAQITIPNATTPLTTNQRTMMMLPDLYKGDTRMSTSFLCIPSGFLPSISSSKKSSLQDTASGTDPSEFALPLNLDALLSSEFP
jgi:hypothetical protein